jgi:membrane protein
VSSDGGAAAGPAAPAPSLLDRVDRLQQRHTVLGFPVAVGQKYVEDLGPRHAAMLTYYGFLSIFPVLLLVVVGLTRLLSEDSELRADVIDSIVPEELRSTVDAALLALPTGGLPLAIGLVALLLSGLGIVNSAYHTLNQVASVPHRLRHLFFPRYVRVVAMLLLLLVGIAGIGAITTVWGALPDVPLLSRLGGFVGSTMLIFLLLWASVELLLPHRARFRIVWPAALIGSLVIAGVISFGAVVLPTLVARAGAVYGSFATIVGLFTLLFLVSQALVIAAEVAMVRHRRLWPRSLDPRTPIDADRRALTLLARVQERTPVERITATFDTDPS